MTRQIVITGASSGIGAALVRALAAGGDAVYACARRGERLREVVQGCPTAFGQSCDVSQEAEVEAFVAWVRSKAGRVDALINCAGRFGAIGPVLETDSREWLRTVEDNLFGTYLMVKAVAPLMERERRPRVINFSGGGAFGPFPCYSAYAVSKAGVVRLTEILAVELAPLGIRVNAVAPGFVATEIHEATLRSGPARSGAAFFEQTRRMLQEGAVPMDIPVSCVRFLLSDAAAALTGKTISAAFDPWGSPAFVECLEELNRSDAYTLRRINAANLTEPGLRQKLEAAQEEAKVTALRIA